MMHTASKKGPALEPTPALRQVEPLHVPISITRPTSGGSRGMAAFPPERGITSHARKQAPSRLSTSSRALVRAFCRGQALGVEGCGQNVAVERQGNREVNRSRTKQTHHSISLAMESQQRSLPPRKRH